MSCGVNINFVFLRGLLQTFKLSQILDTQDLDVEGDGMQGPPSPLQFDTALALEDQTIRAIAEAPMDILTGEDPDQDDLEASGQELSEKDVDAIMGDQVIHHNLV